MRFGLLTQWYDPEPGPAALPGALARGLRDAGHEVSVLTGFPNYPTGELHSGYTQEHGYVETVDGINVRRAPVYLSHDERPLHRIANYASFGFSATRAAKDFFKNLDAVWVNYSPVTIAMPLWRGQRLFDTPAVVEVGDLWPDTIFASGMVQRNVIGRLGEYALNAWCSRIYRSASSVVYISPSVGGILSARGLEDCQLSYVPKWADEEVFNSSGDRSSAREEFRIPETAKVLVYAGTLGGAQGLSSLIKATSLVNDPDFLLVIAGSGTEESKLRKLALESPIRNVRFLGRVPQARMNDLMAAADFCYVGLAQNPLSQITMPSKTQAILASGKPLLAAAHGDLTALVSQNSVGRTADPASPYSIAASIEWFCKLSPKELSELGERASALYEKEFSLARGVKHIEALLIQAAEQNREPDVK
ncbi:glycosyltransferase family 4 protein [Dietzia sp. B32]|uniref:glycosyltransferase family 4 protein n=1 Tax=Dietzia sp. B32 TaxID=2915130 RepID=UPI0021ADD5A0|nr:glycosyltransferase family 4 protein [Dietzia sp. B32]UVE96432.1 glycosyltransferase family 4 protein [Dietzia sp. B32]